MAVQHQVERRLDGELEGDSVYRGALGRVYERPENILDAGPSVGRVRHDFAPSHRVIEDEVGEGEGQMS